MVRITRQEMKRDELASTLSGLTLAAERHARSLAVVVAALVVLGAAAGGGLWYSRDRDAAAREKLGAVQRAAAAPAADETPAEAQAAPRYTDRRQKYEEVLRLAGVVLAEHPGSAAARWASYYKALAQKELGDREGALRTLEGLTTARDDLASGAGRVLEAQVREAQGDLEGAARAYASLAASPPAGFPVDLALANEARLLDAQGKTSEATEVLRRLSQEHPDSPYAREASRRVGEARG